jgi:hypothetical protein
MVDYLRLRRSRGSNSTQQSMDADPRTLVSRREALTSAHAQPRGCASCWRREYVERLVAEFSAWA